MDSPRRELYVRGLGFVVALLVCSRVNLLCASTGGVILLYIAGKRVIVGSKLRVFTGPLNTHLIFHN